MSLQTIEQQQEEWAGENVRYIVQYQSIRVTTNEDGTETQTPISTLNFRPLNYPTFLAVERGIAEIYALIIEGWAEIVVEGDRALGAVFTSVVSKLTGRRGRDER